jgi:hypothetical protein|tara:strand:- start:629 stop:1354 length:726 start_codon:yes stop_codon:yes gene_type:complete
MAFSRIRLDADIASDSAYLDKRLEFGTALITGTPTAWVHNYLAIPQGNPGSNAPSISLDFQGIDIGGLRMTSVDQILLTNKGENPIGVEYWTLLETIGPGSFEILGNELRDKSGNGSFANCHIGTFLLVENADEAANNRLVLVSQHHEDFPNHIVLAQHYLAAFVADGGDTNVTFKRLQRNEFKLGAGGSMIIPGELFSIASTTFASTAVAPGSLFETEQHEMQIWGIGGASEAEILVMGA